MRAATTTLIAILALWGAAALAAQTVPTSPSTHSARHSRTASASQPAQAAPSAQQTPAPQKPEPIWTSEPAPAPGQNSQPGAGAQQLQPPSASQPAGQQPASPAEAAPGLSGQPAPPALPSQAATEKPAAYSADNLYNLANQYARAGKPGLAVLNYERAALLAPHDDDITSNLEYVRATAQVPTDPHTRFTRFAQLTSPTLAAWLGVIGITLLGASLLSTKATRRYRALRVIATLLGLGFIALPIANATLLWPRLHEAVILINQTPARVSPVPMGDTAFVLREAETVTMTAEHEDYVLIRTRAGRTGWVARASIGAVVPQ